ncbi:tyrosine kinase receptor CEK2, partial [Haematococcus lacustris]
MVLGVLHHSMAPEAFDGVATHSGDVWSFGCLLWQV